jgi:hemolysin-activating ACP:hemolysin acyltransferase
MTISVKRAAALGFLEQVGLAATLMGQSPRYRGYPIAVIHLWLEPAIRHDQIKFFFDESGIPVGYMTWAWLTEDTEFRLIHDRTILLHISEWNEGDRLWILDLILINADIRTRLREAAIHFAHAEFASSLRRRSDGSVRKVTVWNRTAFENTSRQRK